MEYWINIHHPIGATMTSSQQLMVYVPQVAKSYPSSGDRVFIYVTEALSGQVIIVKDSGGAQTLTLGKGEKGIIALVEVDGDLHREYWWWGGKPYVGRFDTNVLRAKLVRLDGIRTAYDREEMGKTFNPRGPTGLRMIRCERELKILLRLMGL